MNKEDAKRRLKVIELESQRLQEMIEAPEKPKLGHGDFGSYKSGNGWIVLYRNEPFLETFGYKSGAGSNAECDDGLTNVLGNVFDLMKDWDKPFEEFCKGYISKGIRIVGKCIEMYSCTGGSCNKKNNPCRFNIEKAEKWHNALGHAIADLKRKENKSD